ncbi:MAG: type 4a pilus biogenesis protein PilO [Fibrobacterales bacterium]
MFEDHNKIRTMYAAAVTLLIVAIGYGFWSLFLIENWNFIDVNKENIKNRELQYQRIQRQVKRVDDLRTEVRKAQRELTELKAMFPDQESVPLRLNDLYKVLRTSGVKITGFKPLEQKDIKPVNAADDPKYHYRENIYTVELETGYHMLGVLFEGLANLGYPISLRNVRINKYAGLEQELEKSERHGWVPTTIAVSFNLVTYSSREGN